MDDYDPYDSIDLSDAEMVEAAMGNTVGEAGIALKESTVRLTKVQAGLISEALSQYDSTESDLETEVAQRTERLIREKFDLE